MAQGIADFDQDRFGDPDLGGVAHTRQKGFGFGVILISLVEQSLDKNCIEQEAFVTHWWIRLNVSARRTSNDHVRRPNRMAR